MPVRSDVQNRYSLSPGSLSCGFTCPEMSPAAHASILMTRPSPCRALRAEPRLPPKKPWHRPLGFRHRTPSASDPCHAAPALIVFQKLHFDDLLRIFMENTRIRGFVGFASSLRRPFVQTSGSQPGRPPSPSRGGTFAKVRRAQLQGAPSLPGVEAKDAAEHPTTHRTACTPGPAPCWGVPLLPWLCVKGTCFRDDPVTRPSSSCPFVFFTLIPKRQCFVRILCCLCKPSLEQE